MIGKRFSSGSNSAFKILYLLAALGIFIAIGTGVYALTTGNIPAINPGHNSTQVFISVGNGQYVTLQDAFNYGYFVGGSASNIPRTSLPSRTPYELASQILITISGKTMTLQEAFGANSDNRNVFSSGAIKSYTTSVPVGGEIASNIKVNTINGLTDFQSAITGSLLSPCTSGQHWVDIVGCTTNGLGQSCTPTGLSSECVSGYTIQNDGSCGGSGTKLAHGTACGSDDWHACDGLGHCQGWSGTGCGSCPFGATSQSGGYLRALCYLCSSGSAGTSSCPSPYVTYQGAFKRPEMNSYGIWFVYNAPGTYGVECSQYANCDWLGNCQWVDSSWKIKPS